MGLGTDRHARANRSDLIAQAAWLNTRDFQLVEEAEVKQPIRPAAVAASARAATAKASPARPAPARPAPARPAPAVAKAAPAVAKAAPAVAKAAPAPSRPALVKRAAPARPLVARAAAPSAPPRLPVARPAPAKPAPPRVAVARPAPAAPARRSAPPRPREESFALNTSDLVLVDPIDLAPQITEAAWFQEEGSARLSPPTELVDALVDEPAVPRTGLFERMPVLLGMVFGAFVLGAVVVFFFVHTLAPQQPQSPTVTEAALIPPAPPAPAAIVKPAAPAPSVTQLPAPPAPEPVAVVETPRPVAHHAIPKRRHHAIAHAPQHHAAPRIVASAKRVKPSAPRSAARAAADWTDPFGE